MSSALHLAVRTLHVLTMVALVGGSAATWNALRTAGPDAAALRRFECGFWAALGVLLATGVGNLGALGAPEPGTRWGGLFTAKLLVVLAVVLGSFLRTAVVLRLPDRASGLGVADHGDGAAGVDEDDPSADPVADGGLTRTDALDDASGPHAALRRAYLATAASLVAVVVLAEVLAHG